MKSVGVLRNNSYNYCATHCSGMAGAGIFVDYPFIKREFREYINNNLPVGGKSVPTTNTVLTPCA